MSRIEWQWRDEGSGPGHMQRVIVHDEDPAEAAYRRMLAHGAACSECWAVNETGERRGDCDAAKRLYEEYREARRGPAAERSPAPA